MGFTFCSRDCFHPVGYPRTPRATERHTAALRPACRSIPAAKFRLSAELKGATKAALNSPLKDSELNAALVAIGLAMTAGRE